MVILLVFLLRIVFNLDITVPTLKFQNSSLMKNNSPAELQLHGYVLNSRGASTMSLLIEKYSDHLLKFLLRHYKRELAQHHHAASEAVYNALEWYHEHPRQFLPSQGSLRKFLELRVDRNLQLIFEKERYPFHIHRIDHLLAPYIDNERDLQIAKLLLKNEHQLSAYLPFTNPGILRFHQLKSEILHLKSRVREMLSAIPGLKPSRIANARIAKENYTLPLSAHL